MLLKRAHNLLNQEKTFYNKHCNTKIIENVNYFSEQNFLCISLLIISIVTLSVCSFGKAFSKISGVFFEYSRAFSNLFGNCS
jgi:hypothetical protein